MWKNITSTSNIVIVSIFQHSYLEKHRRPSCQDTNINEFFHKDHLNPNCGTPPRVWVMLSGWAVVRFAWLDLPGILGSSIIQKPKRMWHVFHLVGWMSHTCSCEVFLNWCSSYKLLLIMQTIFEVDATLGTKVLDVIDTSIIIIISNSNWMVFATFHNSPQLGYSFCTSQGSKRQKTSRHDIPSLFSYTFRKTRPQNT